MGERARRILTVFLATAMVVPAVCVLAQDARTEYLVRLLRTSEAFRVRAQAALSLGNVPASPPVIDALTGALADAEPAVRAAACASLERLGDPSALPRLRSAERDASPEVREACGRARAALERVPPRGEGRAVAGAGTAVGAAARDAAPRGTPRYYVGVGQPGTRVPTVDPQVLRQARTFIANRVQQIEGVVVAPESETPRDATRVLRERSLTGFYLDSSIVSLETRPDGGVRAQVSVIVQTYPGRDVRSMLSGAATVMGETGPAAQRAAIEAALNGALRNLTTALQAGGTR